MPVEALVGGTKFGKKLAKTHVGFGEHSGHVCQIGGAQVMQGKAREQWMQLCEQAAVEQDAEKLLALVKEINRMLEEKDRRLQLARSSSTE